MTVFVAGIQVNFNGKEDFYKAESANDHRFHVGPLPA